MYEVRLKLYFDDQSAGCSYFCRVEDTRGNFVDSLI